MTLAGGSHQHQPADQYQTTEADHGVDPVSVWGPHRSGPIPDQQQHSEDTAKYQKRCGNGDDRLGVHSSIFESSDLQGLLLCCQTGVMS